MTFSENNSRCRRYLQSKNMKIKKTEGLRTFEKCFLEKKDKQFLLLEKGHAVTLQILFLRGVFRWCQKVERNIFQSYFLEIWCS